MKFIDVMGPPGVGKSALCDDLWSPHAIDWRGVTDFPQEWGPFLLRVDSLLHKVARHWSFDACLGMVRRSLCKMAAVHRTQSDDTYIQTGFAQRGLGFGWRLDNPEDVRAYYELMPVSLGVVSLNADIETLQARNRSRAARGENRDFMVPLMVKAHRIAIETLKERDVPLLELDTRRPVTELRQELEAFHVACRRSKAAVHKGSAGSHRQMAHVQPMA